ncbi:MAG: antibiotic biosynthesis monooxygenase [Acidimicrobiia bacterium]|nr:antibiotic biosynthesis monooxygenase [Acidimicrobiia bacterium]
MTCAVFTTVAVEPGSIDELAELFDATNRSLVADHDDWLGAWFTADRETSTVTVVARWRSPDSYRRLRESPAFEQTMARFAARFTGPPEVRLHEILVEM